MKKQRPVDTDYFTKSSHQEKLEQGSDVEETMRIFANFILDKIIEQHRNGTLKESISYPKIKKGDRDEI